jgi:hypothetical protein
VHNGTVIQQEEIDRLIAPMPRHPDSEDLAHALRLLRRSLMGLLTDGEKQQAIQLLVNCRDIMADPYERQFPLAP